MELVDKAKFTWDDRYVNEKVNDTNKSLLKKEKSLNVYFKFKPYHPQGRGGVIPTPLAEFENAS